jgi:hypothetical protein
MVFCLENLCAKRQRQSVFEPIDLVLVGIEFDLHELLYVNHTCNANGDFSLSYSPIAGLVYGMDRKSFQYKYLKSKSHAIFGKVG